MPVCRKRLVDATGEREDVSEHMVCYLLLSLYPSFCLAHGPSRSYPDLASIPFTVRVCRYDCL